MTEPVEPLGRLMSITQVADYLGIGEKTVRRFISSGELPAFRLGKRAIRMHEKDVQALLRRIPTAGQW
jgi:excisionase family DNA binding protein